MTDKLTLGEHVQARLEGVVVCHNIQFHRRGSCKRCGACERKKCPHLSIQNGLATCDTYGTGDYLERNCNVFPDHPFCRVVLEGICGFKFIPVTEEDSSRYKEFIEKWQLAT